MNNRLKTILYIMSGIVITWIILSLAIKIFIWLLPFILVLYAVFIIRGYINNKKRNKASNEIKYNSREDNIDFVETYSNLVDDSTVEVIEVEYTDIDK
ncbi:hypothetical protein [Caproiciproducens sp. MSJ-32]|uniref:hypothetical protein n=1 Tax=Caproiciproducens sp. MSJ-32 TaxID=2841527 RepID=UPI001C0FA31D|nr:hypothetical protein [Caproiciproducens sp. MSJ-32]MBU5454416.1 hypothetical protein [Caproiciproducens sp. MSJ-32]